MAGIDAVRAYCGWHIAPSQSETLKVEGDGGRVLLLPSLHVTDCTAVRDESGAAVADFKVRENGVARGWWKCEELYAFDVTHGYSAMPAEVADIIADLDERGTSSPGALVQVGQVRYATGSDGAPLGGALTLGQMAVLDRYKLPPRP